MIFLLREATCVTISEHIASFRMDSKLPFDVPEMHSFKLSKESRLEALRMPFCLGDALIVTVRTSSLQICVSESHISSDGLYDIIKQ